jgi:hypothetical protein
MCPLLVWKRGTAIGVRTVFAAITTLPNTISEVAVVTPSSLPKDVANDNTVDVADYAPTVVSFLTGLLITHCRSDLEHHCSFVHCTHIFALSGHDLLAAIECQAGQKKRHRMHVAMNRNTSRRTADG